MSKWLLRCVNHVEWASTTTRLDQRREMNAKRAILERTTIRPGKNPKQKLVKFAKKGRT